MVHEFGFIQLGGDCQVGPGYLYLRDFVGIRFWLLAPDDGAVIEKVYLIVDGRREIVARPSDLEFAQQNYGLKGVPDGWLVVPNPRFVVGGSQAIRLDLEGKGQIRVLECDVKLLVPDCMVRR